jgi:uncharacterized protein (TIGR02300 family)
VTKPELGTKRICGNCSSKFYDLHKSPIVCPTCQTVFEPPIVVAEKQRRPLEARTASAQKAAKVHPASAIIPGDGSNEDAIETKERDEEDVNSTERDEEDAGIDEDSENFTKE